MSEVCLDKRSPNFGLTEQGLLIRAGETPLQENDRHDRARNRNLGVAFGGVPVVASDALKPGQNPLLVNRPRGAGFMGTALALDAIYAIAGHEQQPVDTWTDQRAAKYEWEEGDIVYMPRSTGTNAWAIENIEDDHSLPYGIRVSLVDEKNVTTFGSPHELRPAPTVFRGATRTWIVMLDSGPLNRGDYRISHGPDGWGWEACATMHRGNAESCAEAMKACELLAQVKP